jgi:hypothetical protein
VTLICCVHMVSPAQVTKGPGTPGKNGLVIGNHTAKYDGHGILLPWTSWLDALGREMNWYLKCPIVQGYPSFVWMTFMDGNYKPDPTRHDLIPATQNGMGIISYLKYYAYDGRRNDKVLQWARYMGDYLVKECNSPDAGKYPRFTRSTGTVGQFPQSADCGTQQDGPYEVQPDKGGLAGYALLLLYRETKVSRYLEQALNNARVLARNMKEGDSTHSPWPFRVDFRTGEGRGEVAGNMVYILRLFDLLGDMGYPEFATQRQRLWTWIRDQQIPSLSGDGRLWVQFFEDHAEPDNRTAWSPLNLARYLLEKKDTLDPQWQLHAKALIEFVNGHFTSIRNGITICGEQDYDRNPWGGILSTYGAVLAMYGAATGSDEYKGLAWQALNFAMYAINDDGCPGEQASYPGRGGWQEDAHTDVIHNFMDAIRAVPEWAGKKAK